MLFHTTTIAIEKNVINLPLVSHLQLLLLSDEAGLGLLELQL